MIDIAWLDRVAGHSLRMGRDLNARPLTTTEVEMLGRWYARRVHSLTAASWLAGKRVRAGGEGSAA